MHATIARARPTFIVPRSRSFAFAKEDYVMQIRSLGDLSTALDNDPKLQADIKTDPAGTIKNLAVQAQIPDTWVYRLVILTLGTVLIGVVAGGFAMAAYGKTIPEALVSIGSAALGALAGLLAPSPVTKS
jgi:hypothetical protein